MTSKSRNSTTKSAEGSPRSRSIKEQKKSRPCGRNRGDAAAMSRSCDHQEPLRRTESKLRRESAIKRVTQNA
jgi:hypothetical protein